MDRIVNHHTGLRLFTEMLAIPSPSGREDRMIAFIADRLRNLGYAPEVDPIGNVLIRLEGRFTERPVCCIAAHVDEIGLVVTAIESDGALHVNRLGGTLPWKLGETPVEILGDAGSILGVVSMGSGHSPMEASECPAWEGIRVLTGLSAKAVGDAGVRVGTPIVPARDARGPAVFGDSKDPWVAAWTFDNRLSVVCLLQVLEQLKTDALAMRERPDLFIAIDGSALVPECPVTLDGSPGIRSQDRAAVYDQDLLREIMTVSSDVGVDLQPVIYDRAASDASLVYSIGASPRVACLGYIRASSHGFEVAPLVTFDKLRAVIESLLASL